MSIAVRRRASSIGLVLLALATLTASCAPRRPSDDAARSRGSLRPHHAAVRAASSESGGRLDGTGDLAPGPARAGRRAARGPRQLLAVRAERIRPADLDPTEAPRLAYLRGQLRALTLVARRLLGESTRFDEEVRLAFGRPLPAGGRRRIASRARRPGDRTDGPGHLVGTLPRVQAAVRHRRAARRSCAGSRNRGLPGRDSAAHHAAGRRARRYRVRSVDRLGRVRAVSRGSPDPRESGEPERTRRAGAAPHGLSRDVRRTSPAAGA